METLGNVFAPYIGANGNWYVEHEDTGVKAQGPEGEQGPVGPSGAQGIRGSRGETGDRGPQGVQGSTGSTGIQGPKGERGDTGEQGPTGQQGIQGPKGDKGDKGDAGPTGAKGDKGDVPSLTENLLATAPGTALDAIMGKALDDRIESLNSRLTLDDPWHDMITPGQYYARYTKRAGIVTVQIYITSTAPEIGYADIGLVLPAGYRPIYHYFGSYIDGLALETRPIMVDTAGNICPNVASVNTQFDVIATLTFATFAT